MNTADDKITRANTFWLRNCGGRSLNFLEIEILNKFVNFFVFFCNLRRFIRTFTSYRCRSCRCFLSLCTFLPLNQWTHFILQFLTNNLTMFTTERTFFLRCLTSMRENVEWFLSIHNSTIFRCLHDGNDCEWCHNRVWKELWWRCFQPRDSCEWSENRQKAFRFSVDKWVRGFETPQKIWQNVNHHFTKSPEFSMGTWTRDPWNLFQKQQCINMIDFSKILCYFREPLRCLIEDLSQWHNVMKHESLSAYSRFIQATRETCDLLTCYEKRFLKLKCKTAT